MDLWVVAAVAGAGCLAKYWNRLSKNGDSCSLSSEDSNFEKAGKDKLGNNVSLDTRASDVDGLLTTELATNTGLDSEKVTYFRNNNESDVLYVDGNEQSSNVGGSYGFLLPDLFAGELGSSGNKTFPRTKHLYGHISRPLNSLESCLMAQLCKKHAKMEKYVSSSSTATRSFLDIDGSQIISRTNADDSFSAVTGSEEYKLQREVGQLKDENELFGVPWLPKIGSFSDAKKMKFNAGNGQSRRLSSSNIAISGKHILTQYEEERNCFRS
ncbi:hypothetical protein SESBI_13458 [Sesbania bispinosa]|nr:hypothetical protein SESBI_13458 [Sesbania bispinosa]